MGEDGRLPTSFHSLGNCILTGPLNTENRMDWQQ